MKTNKLIELLKEADPSGELEVNCEGKDIYFLEVLPGYWDGPYETLVRDPKLAPYYDIVGVTVRRDGNKVCIKTVGYSDAILNDPDIPIYYSDEHTKSKFQEKIEKDREETKKMIEEVNKDFESRKK